MPKFEVIQGDPNAPHEKSKADLKIVGGKSSGKSERAVSETAGTSRFERKLAFNKLEITELIKTIAEKEGLEPDGLVESQETYDQKGNLILLEMKATPEQAQKLGWEDVRYVFVVRGEYKTAGGYAGGVKVSINRFNYSEGDSDTSVLGSALQYNSETGTWEEKEPDTYVSGARASSKEK